MYKSVLVVDDVELSREIIKSSLIDKNKNINVVAVENAYSAIYKMRNRKFDLVVMDIMMPNGDGFELLNMLSQLAISTKVIIISSLDSLFIDVFAKVGMLYELDIVATFEKPIKSIDLAERINSILEEDKTSVPFEEIKLFDYPVGVYYQPSILMPSRQIVGLDVTSNWEALQGSPLLSASFLPDIESFSHKRFFNRVFISKFVSDYNNYFLPLDIDLQFTLHIHIESLNDKFISDELLFIIKLNDKHRFKVFVRDTHDVSKLDHIFPNGNNNAELLLDNGLMFVLECNGSDPSSILCESVLPAEEVKFSERVTHSITYSNAKLPTQPEGSVFTFDGIESVEASEFLYHKGFHRQQGILFGSPISAPTMLNLLL